MNYTKYLLAFTLMPNIAFAQAQQPPSAYGPIIVFLGFLHLYLFFNDQASE